MINGKWYMIYCMKYGTWCHMTWYDMIWKYDMIEHDMIEYEMMYGMKWYDVILSKTWNDSILTWYDIIWYDMWHDYDMIWHDMIWISNQLLEFEKDCSKSIRSFGGTRRHDHYWT